MTARVDNERREEVARTKTSLALLFAMLGGPLAALCNLMIDYPTVDRACVDGSSLVLHVLSLVFLLVALAATDDAAEGVRSFLEGRAPRFTGR